VKLTDFRWARTEAFRRSSSTGHLHSIGGFTGWAEYSGPIGKFLPLLQIGRWTGVGRQTVWGKGEIRIGSADASLSEP
jgi:CRISPR/Cas system endoribonuclease Cas6 (RAMP superfamily)